MIEKYEINLQNKTFILKDGEEREFEEEFEDLERRYQSKNKEIRAKQEKIDRDTKTESQNGGTEETIGVGFQQGSDELRAEFEEISEDYKRIIDQRKESNRGISEKTAGLSEFFKQLERNFQR